MQVRKIKKGSCLGIICPSSRCNEPLTLHRFLDFLISQGFKYKLGKTVEGKNGYFSGTDKQKADDLNGFFKDDEVDAILCFRGGYGSIRFLDLIDYELIKKNPKLVVGFSDVTALINAIYQKTGVVMLHGEMGVRFKEEYVNNLNFSFRNLIETLLGIAPKNLLSDVENEVKKPIVFKPFKNIVEGVVVGGNLTLVCSMMGTPYEIDTTDKILLLEDVQEAPYKIDRYLATLKISKKLEKAKAIIFGHFYGCDSSDDTQSLIDVLNEYSKDLNIPVIYNFPTGHDHPFISIPIGCKIAINSLEQSVIVLEDLFFDK